MAAHTHAVEGAGMANPSGNHEALLAPEALDRKPSPDRHGMRIRTTGRAWGGFDTLGFRLSADIPKAEILELDHPSTQGAKLRAWSLTP